MARRKPLSMREAWVLWVAMLTASAVFIWVSEAHGKIRPGPLKPLHWTIAVLGVWSAYGGYVVRGKLIAQVAAKAVRGDAVGASRKWSVAHLVGLTSVQGTILWGVFAKMSIGCPQWFSALFYGVGLLLLLLWTPSKRPIAPNP